MFAFVYFSYSLSPTDVTFENGFVDKLCILQYVVDLSLFIPFVMYLFLKFVLFYTVGK